MFFQLLPQVSAFIVTKGIAIDWALSSSEASARQSRKYLVPQYAFRPLESDGEDLDVRIRACLLDDKPRKKHRQKDPGSRMRVIKYLLPLPLPLLFFFY